jgi:DNA-binding CsgD family transcriptional regulator
MARTSSKALPQNEVVERLDLILRVLALQVAADKSVTERARLLKMAGLDNSTIADILNTSDATVRTLTTNLRAKKTSKRGKL